ncbi:MAG TPA: phospholipase [Gammaproteobacteria bacterium]|nr:phospholipase [Gammaproteobacteria bacterium]
MYNAAMLIRILSLVVVAVLVSACATPVKPHAEPVSYAIPSVDSSQAWNPLHKNLPSQVKTSWFSTLNTGEESLARRLALIDTATVSIDAMYFLWLEDAVGSLRFERLLNAADRGVRVRVLIDDSFLAGEDSVLLALDEHPNVELRIYNPFDVRSKSLTSRYIENLNDLSRTNHRMHNKLLIGDGTVAIVGGRNIADEYFGFGREQNFRDYDVFTTGEIVPELAEGFDLFWNSGWAFPAPEIDHKYANEEDFKRLRKDLRVKASELDAWQTDFGTQRSDWSDDWATIAPSMIEGKAELLMDLPRFDQQAPAQVAHRLREVFMASDEEILAITAYLVPPDGFMEVIQEQARRGTTIKFLTNSLASNNHVPAHTAYEHHRKALLRAGAELYEVRPDGLDRDLYEAAGRRARHFGLHGKVIIIDSDTVFVGTLNLDPRSLYLNTEIGLLITSPELNAKVRQEFMPSLSARNSWRVLMAENGDLSWHSHDGVQHKQPAGSFGRRLLDKLLGPVPLDSQM